MKTTKPSRGGARPGAGRPKGSTKAKTYAPASPAELTPVEYALRVMRDETADVRRRDAMARALLSYLRAGGKRVEKSEAGPKTADKWAGILK